MSKCTYDSSTGHPSYSACIFGMHHEDKHQNSYLHVENTGDVCLNVSPDLKLFFSFKRVPYFFQSCWSKLLSTGLASFVCLYPLLTLKAPITTAADNILFFKFSKKTSHDISCESSAWQTIHMKYQDLVFFEKLKKKRMSSATNFAWCFKGKLGIYIAFNNLSVIS